MKSPETLALERAVAAFNHKMGIFGCFEVTIGWFGKERVDYMTYDTKGTWRCYEIKVSKSDFRSGNHNTFCGHFNYYVMPEKLYEQVKNEIPAHVGVYVDCPSYPYCRSVKKAIKRPLSEDEQVLKDSMIRSLSRDAGKYQRELRRRDKRDENHH